MNKDQSIEILEKSAMIRVLFEVVGVSKKNNFGKNQVKIKKVDVFPLAFLFSDDITYNPVILINEAISNEPSKILDNLPTSESGFYELVGEFYGKFSIKNQTLMNSIWELSEIKAYQLTDEEIDLLPIPLRSSLENKL